jgi:hypothetical protein
MPFSKSAGNSTPNALCNQILMGSRATTNEPVEQTVFKASQEGRG